ncbi:MAG: hypothetical protein CMJ81_05350 [Planctomycetaceae bacterium]|nr:hypothetical protein [Planctomycetaceae bacterium]
MNLLPSRREFLTNNALGVGGIALAHLLQQERLLATPAQPALARESFDLQPRIPAQTPQVRAMISLFMHGGPSHMDLTDPKPVLSKYNGTQYTKHVGFSSIKRSTKVLLGSPFKFRRHGQCGTELSELLPHTSKIVDDICLIRSMHTGHNGHEVSIRYWHSGIAAVLGRPTMGAWLTYALGSESQDLPAYMVLTDPGGPPVDTVHNWANGWMPSLYQGTVLRPREPRIFNLQPPAHLQGDLQRQNLDFLARLNRKHAQRLPGESDLEARIASYELAARMQTSAAEALDISRETRETLQLYGIDRPQSKEYGTRCLIARRLIERGVRFVQLFLDHQPWDNHHSIHKNLTAICGSTDQPAAALVQDLKQRGLLETTLVHWGGEIGRLPVTEDNGNPEKVGRDHNGQGFSCWLAGGGIRGGMTFGQTDDFGHHAVVNKLTPNDIQATILHLFGLDHQQLVFLYNGRQQSLTNGRPCRVVSEILERSS